MLGWEAVGFGGFVAYHEYKVACLVRSLPNRSEWLRQVITEAAERLQKAKEND